MKFEFYSHSLKKVDVLIPFLLNVDNFGTKTRTLKLCVHQ